MNWEDVVAVATASFAVVIRGESWVGIAWQEGLSPDAAPQKVKLVACTALGSPHVSIFGDVFERGRLDPAFALELNHALVLGAIEYEADRVLLRVTLALDGLAPDYLRRVVVHVARQSAHMRTVALARSAEAATFAHYVE